MTTKSNIHIVYNQCLKSESNLTRKLKNTPLFRYIPRCRKDLRSTLLLCKTQHPALFQMFLFFHIKNCHPANHHKYWSVPINWGSLLFVWKKKLGEADPTRFWLFTFDEAEGTYLVLSCLQTTLWKMVRQLKRLVGLAGASNVHRSSYRLQIKWERTGWLMVNFLNFHLCLDRIQYIPVYA